MPTAITFVSNKANTRIDQGPAEDDNHMLRSSLIILHKGRKLLQTACYKGLIHRFLAFCHNAFTWNMYICKLFKNILKPKRTLQECLHNRYVLINFHSFRSALCLNKNCDIDLDVQQCLRLYIIVMHSRSGYLLPLLVPATPC